MGKDESSLQISVRVGCVLDVREEHVKLMEEMNTARNDNYLFIRKTISNIIQRRFAMLSESFSRQVCTSFCLRMTDVNDFCSLEHKFLSTSTTREES